MSWDKTLESLLDLRDDVLDFIFPQHCIICKKYLSRKEQNVCQICWDNLVRLPFPFCVECRSLVEKDSHCRQCQNESDLDLVYSLGAFDDSYQNLIYAFKYDQLTNLGKRLGTALGEQIKEDKRFTGLDFLIPVPLHPSRKRKRGFNQSEILTDEISQKIGLPALKDVLRKKKRTKDQTNLNAMQREENVRGAFEIKNKDMVLNKNIVLVDDVITTGATLKECARTLAQAGASRILGLTVAVVGE